MLVIWKGNVMCPPKNPLFISPAVCGYCRCRPHRQHLKHFSDGSATFDIVSAPPSILPHPHASSSVSAIPPPPLFLYAPPTAVLTFSLPPALTYVSHCRTDTANVPHHYLHLLATTPFHTLWTASPIYTLSMPLTLPA